MPSRLDVSISSLSRCNWAMLGLSALVAAVLTLAANNSALANWWLVRSSDGKCLVVDVDPTEKDKNVTKIGKKSADEAEADAKRLCKEANKPDQSSPPDQ